MNVKSSALLAHYVFAFLAAAFATLLGLQVVHAQGIYQSPYYIVMDTLLVVVYIIGAEHFRRQAQSTPQRPFGVRRAEGDQT